MSKLLLDARVPYEYKRGDVSDIIRTLCNQVNDLSEGRIAARYQAHTAIPTGSAVSYAKGDIVWDSNPTVASSVGSGIAANYIRLGWICVAPGSPGTFKEMGVASGGDGLASGMATFLSTPTSANLAAAVTNETGSGALVFATSPSLVTPILGTPTSGTLTNCTGLPAAGVVGTALVSAAIGTTVQAYDADLTTWAGITPGTGVGTALAVNIGTAGSFITNGGALGSPSSAGTIPAFTLGGTVAGGGNQLNNVIIGTSTPLAGSFTTLSASGTVTGTALIPTGSTVPANGMYLSAANTVSFSTNTTFAGNINASQEFGFGQAATGTVRLSTYAATSASDTYAFIAFSSAGNDRFRVRGDGQISIPTFGVGTLTSDASGVITSVSDEEFKIKDGTIQDPIPMLMALSPGYYLWADKSAFNSQRQLGFYAQNVNQAIGEEAAPTPQMGVAWGYYDRSVLAVVVEAAKGHEERIVGLEKTVSKLILRVQELETKIQGNASADRSMTNGY